MTNTYAHQIAAAVIEAAAKECELWNTTPGSRLAEAIRERLDIDAIIASVPRCIEGDRCVCGGDTPAVRATCGNWIKGINK